MIYREIKAFSKRLLFFSDRCCARPWGGPKNVVCTLGVNQNPITAEVTDAVLQVSRVSTDCSACISTRT